MSVMMDSQVEIKAAVKRRRNFAIISHPDAGKTTLTEKLLLYGGAIHEAGAVKARRARRHAVSDWMIMEQQRGISITSTVLQFEYQGYHINLLDTPGHQDFSEDTYRTLSAADNAVMLIDHAKGLEIQTRKLFDVCRMRSLPTFTFINKLDRAGRPPLQLLDEIEKEFGLKVYAANWPIGMGTSFRGVLDRRTRLVHLFERHAHGRQEAMETVLSFEDPSIESLIEPDLRGRVKEELEILDSVGSTVDLEAVHAGELTPVFFGSAVTNFGVKLFLDVFLEYSAQPRSFPSSRGCISPTHPEFSAFIFKIQANMDPRHRDCLAFVRICSGKFKKDMMVKHARTGRTLRLSQPRKLFAREREVMQEAFPGDVIGLNNPGLFSIGDTLYIGPRLVYPAIPKFAPELFAYLSSPDPSLYKQFKRGIYQLDEEGAIQVLHAAGRTTRDLILAAVGELQFEVVQFRLRAEYGIETRLEILPYRIARWVGGGQEVLKKVKDRSQIETLTLTAEDRWHRAVLLFKSEWHLQKIEQANPEFRLTPMALNPDDLI